jgi:hypothetical protein
MPYREVVMKSFVAGFVVLIAGMGLVVRETGAQEAPIALLERSWPEPGRVTEMRVIHDLQGGVYVPYIAENAFRVLRAGAGGTQGPVMPEGFDGGSLEARNLQAISDGSERYVAFIGRKGGGESIYLFGFGFRDKLSYCPLKETEAGAITDYSLVPSKNGGVMVYTLAGGRLRGFSTGIRGDRLRQLREISRPGETVEAFGIYRERSQETSYGWYRVARKDYWETILFSLNDGGNLVFEKIGSWPRMPRLEYGVSPEGKVVFVVTAEGAVSVCHAEEAHFVRDMDFEAPFAAKRYIPALLTGGSLGLLIGETGGKELLYGVSHERSGAPALRELFAGPAEELLDLFFTEDKRISLIYRSTQTLGAALLNPGGGIIVDKPLPLSSGGSRLFRNPLGTVGVYALSGSGESCVLSLFELEGETWRPVWEAPLSGFSPEEIHSPLGVRNEDLLLLSSPGAIMLYETKGSGGQVLTMENYGRSGALNGVVYLAVGSENGIALYRIEE